MKKNYKGEKLTLLEKKIILNSGTEPPFEKWILK